MKKVVIRCREKGALRTTLGPDARECRWAGGGAVLFCFPERLSEFAIQGVLVIPVIGQGGVDLSQGEIRVLKVKLFRAPAIGLHFRDEFGDLHGGTGDDGHPVVSERDVRVACRGKTHLYSRSQPV